MPIRFLEYASLLLVAMVCAGCAESPTADSDPRRSHAVSPAGARETTINLRPVDYAGLQQFIKSHEDDLLVLDVWSTSCEPCIRELPNLVKLANDFVDRGVVCATLNIDYTAAAGTTPEDANEAAQPVLQALDVDLVNLYSTLGDRELFRRPLFQENHVYAIPAIFVFNRSGDVAATFGEASESGSPYDHVRRAITRLLDDGGTSNAPGDGS